MLKQPPFPRSAVRPFARNRRTVSAIAFAALLWSVPSRVSALDWYRWRGPDANGISKETGWSTAWPSEGPKQLWKANVGTGFSSISISKGRAYTMGNRHDTETVYGLDADTGAVIWKHSYPCVADPNLYEGGPNATPTVDGKVVYTFSRRGHVFALHAETGKVVWSRDLRTEIGLKLPEWGFSGSPLVQGQLLILNAGVGGTALDKETGKTVWTSSKDSAGYSTPIPFDQGQTR
ncbi:MAG TPA: PQQ-binding-like beta-propeller repeat protein, partial [Verrucomicrobiae bacterium]|nr:PQQ-binding-like beta-propeller repeat protein [Verrucomicrobiae bacterium]